MLDPFSNSRLISTKSVAACPTCHNTLTLRVSKKTRNIKAIRCDFCGISINTAQLQSALAFLANPTQDQAKFADSIFVRDHVPSLAQGLHHPEGSTNANH